MDLDIELLETSFDLVAPRGGELVGNFYARVYAEAPDVERLFDGVNTARQRAMVLSVLVLLRRSLRDVEALVPTLRDLGARHVAYGARPEHYPLFGRALVAAIADLAGDVWTPEHERAWRAVFEVLAGAMLEGAAAAEVRLAA